MKNKKKAKNQSWWDEMCRLADMLDDDSNFEEDEEYELGKKMPDQFQSTPGRADDFNRD